MPISNYYGRIVVKNQIHCAAILPDDKFVIFAVKEGEIEIDHIVRGELKIEGEKKISNETTGKRLIVRIEDWGKTLGEAQAELTRPGSSPQISQTTGGLFLKTPKPDDEG